MRAPEKPPRFVQISIATELEQDAVYALDTFGDVWRYKFEYGYGHGWQKLDNVIYQFKKPKPTETERYLNYIDEATAAELSKKESDSE